MGTCGCFCRNLTTFMVLWSLKRHHLWLIDSFFQRWSWPDFGKKRTRFRSKSRDEMSVAKSVGSDRVMWAFQGHFRVEQKKKKSVFSCLNSLWHNFWTKNSGQTRPWAERLCWKPVYFRDVSMLITSTYSLKCSKIMTDKIIYFTRIN